MVKITEKIKEKEATKDKVKGLHTKQLAKLKKATSNSTTATRSNQQDSNLKKVDLVKTAEKTIL